MALIGMAIMNPTAVMSMITSGAGGDRWRPVLHAPSPKVLADYARAKALPLRTGQSRACVVIGASGLVRVHPDRLLFESILVMDDVDTLVSLRRHLPAFTLADVREREPLVYDPVVLGPGDMDRLLTQPGHLPDVLPDLSGLGGALAASVRATETTSRLRRVPLAGVRARLLALADRQKATCPDLVPLYAGYVFRTVDRGTITQRVTKKLPKVAEGNYDPRKELYELLEFADSSVGYAFYSAHHAVSSRQNDDPDYNAHNAIHEFGLSAYREDFLALLAIVPTSSKLVYLPEAKDAGG